MSGFEELAGRSQKRLLVVGIVLLVLVGGLWFLIYSAREMKQSRLQWSEVRAQQTLTTINGALQAYHRKYDGYPDDLSRLRGGEEGTPESAPPERARLLDSALAHDRLEHDGYRFHYRPQAPQYRYAATVQLHQEYRLTAEPVSPGATGTVFYYTDQNGKIHTRPGKSAGPSDPAT